ncbi:MAG: hypothetical protein ACLT40_10155 [Fusobacterium sp.]
MSTFTKMYKSYEKILKLIDEEKSISLDEMSYLLKGLKETKYDNNKLSLIYSYLFKNKYIKNSDYYISGEKTCFDSTTKMEITIKGREYLAELEEKEDSLAISKRAERNSQIANAIAFAAFLVSLYAVIKSQF